MVFFFFLVLLFLIVVSKEFLVFNAETLVLITFVLFVLILVNQLKNSVGHFFDNRHQAILTDIVDVQVDKKHFLLSLRNYLLIDFSLNRIVSSFLVFLKYAQLVSILYSEFLLFVHIHNYIINQLIRLEVVESRLFGTLLNSLRIILFYRVVDVFMLKTNEDKDVILESSILSLY